MFANVAPVWAGYVNRLFNNKFAISALHLACWSITCEIKSWYGSCAWLSWNPPVNKKSHPSNLCISTYTLYAYTVGALINIQMLPLSGKKKATYDKLSPILSLILPILSVCNVEYRSVSSPFFFGWKWKRHTFSSENPCSSNMVQLGEDEDDEKKDEWTPNAALMLHLKWRHGGFRCHRFISL